MTFLGVAPETEVGQGVGVCVGGLGFGVVGWLGVVDWLSAVCLRVVGLDALGLRVLGFRALGIRSVGFDLGSLSMRNAVFG